MNRFFPQLARRLCLVATAFGLCCASASSQQPADLNLMLYYLYANNMQDQWGEYVDDMIGLQSCVDTRIECTADLGTIWLKTYLGREMPGNGLELRRTSSGLYEMPLGQTIYTHKTLGDVILATYDSHLRIYDTTGSISFALQADALVCLHNGWLYGYSPKADRFFNDLTCRGLQARLSNATIAYSLIDDAGTPPRPVSKPALAHRTDAGISVGGALPQGEGFTLNFTKTDLASGETVYIYDKAPAAPSGWDEQGARTGYHRLRAASSESGLASDMVIASYDPDKRQLAWCADCYLLGVTGYDRWQVATSSGLPLYTLTRATVTLDSELGIASTDTDPDGAPEYYSLQGIKIPRPLPGQPCIERSPSGATRLIITPF